MEITAAASLDPESQSEMRLTVSSLLVAGGPAVREMLEHPFKCGNGWERMIGPSAYSPLLSFLSRPLAGEHRARPRSTIPYRLAGSRP